MPTQRRNTRHNPVRRRRRGPRTVTFVTVKQFASGAGQINLTPKDFAFGNTLERSITLRSVSITVSLTGDAGIVASEPLFFRLYNPAIDGDVVKVYGPFIVGVLPKTFFLRYPKMPPTLIGNNATRKLVSAYDLGTNSKLGMLVAAKIHLIEGPPVSTNSLTLDALPEKFELLGVQ